jgi:hypothetical protein
MPGIFRARGVVHYRNRDPKVNDNLPVFLSIGWGIPDHKKMLLAPCAKSALLDSQFTGYSPASPAAAVSVVAVTSTGGISDSGGVSAWIDKRL